MRPNPAFRKTAADRNLAFAQGFGVMDRMKRMILPFRLHITAVDGTWKLNQNKTTAARAGVIAALDAQGGAAADIARAMRDLSDA